MLLVFITKIRLLIAVCDVTIFWLMQTWQWKNHYHLIIQCILRSINHQYVCIFQYSGIENNKNHLEPRMLLFSKRFSLLISTIILKFFRSLRSLIFFWGTIAFTFITRKFFFGFAKKVLFIIFCSYLRNHYISKRLLLFIGSYYFQYHCIH